MLGICIVNESIGIIKGYRDVSVIKLCYIIGGVYLIVNRNILSGGKRYGIGYTIAVVGKYSSCCSTCESCFCCVIYGIKRREKDCLSGTLSVTYRTVYNDVSRTCCCNCGRCFVFDNSCAVCTRLCQTSVSAPLL